jgi:small subunit ribosomal protein S9
LKEMAVAENLATGTGRRKTSVARVFLRKGGGSVTVNGRDLSDYFAVASHADHVRAPLKATSNEEGFDVLITVRGGGMAGQAGAGRLGLARALVSYDETNRPSLRAGGYLTRDRRMVERKKYGQPGARRRFQFSKR